MWDRFIQRETKQQIDPIKPQQTTYDLYNSPMKEVKVDDFYSNIIDWHQDDIFFCNVNTIYRHDFTRNKTRKIAFIENSYLHSIKVTGKYVLTGGFDGYLNFFDKGSKKMKKERIHKSRIAAIDTHDNLIFTGSRDRTVKCLDIRTKEVVDSVSPHTQEVCGVKVSKDGRYIATGGNDNKLVFIDRRMFTQPLTKISSHVAAVKALSWAPYNNNLLVSGGGTADKTIKLWNVNTFECLNSIDTSSQVCNIYWSTKNELVSTHGYSQNEIRVMDSNSFGTKALFRRHKNRVIHFAMAPDEDYFVTGSGENELLFWHYNSKKSIQMYIR